MRGLFFLGWSRHVLEFGDFFLEFTSDHVPYGLFVWLKFPFHLLRVLFCLLSLFESPRYLPRGPDSDNDHNHDHKGHYVTYVVVGTPKNIIIITRK